jgi:hypothetical protein
VKEVMEVARAVVKMDAARREGTEAGTEEVRTKGATEEEEMREAIGEVTRAAARGEEERVAGLVKAVTEWVRWRR